MNNAKQADETPEWDPELGIWKGSKAPGINPDDFPSPLYIFGYGSLIWRPGDLLEGLPSYPCEAIGYRRVFSQRSCDHRGTSSFPGLVLNLVSEEELIKRGYQISSKSPNKTPYNSDNSLQDECHGLIFHIPDDKIVSVLEDLDFREKGGYTRNFINVKLLVDTPLHKKGDILKVVVYIGLESNPNFFLPSINNALNDLTVSTSDLKYSTSTYEDPFLFKRRSISADIISAAIGPSGSNLEYLFKLDQYLTERGMGDRYLSSLSRAVRLRMGTWRSKLFSPQPPLINSSCSHNLDPYFQIKGKLYGWGSNEYGQLYYDNKKSNDEKIEVFAKDISHLVPPASENTFSIQEEFDSINHIEQTSLPAPLDWEELEYVSVLAGSNTSGYLYDNKIRLWGGLVKFFYPKFNKKDESNVSSNISIILNGVIGASLGNDHLLLLLENGKVLCVGENSFGQCNGPSDFCLKLEDIELIPIFNECSHYIFDINITSTLLSSDIKILKLSTGLRHSAAITQCGGLITWGDNSKGQARNLLANESENLIWYPPENKKLIDLSCSSYSTFILDDHGVVYSFGSNKHGELGREIIEDIEINKNKKKNYCNQILPVNLPINIKFQRVSLVNNFFTQIILSLFLFNIYDLINFFFR